MTAQQSTDKTVTDQAANNSVATLLLEDGTCFTGISCGAAGESVGEIFFNTAMIGYVEVISDPALAGRIAIFTYPQVGNYGVALADLESDRLALAGLVVRDMCDTPSNFRSDISLPDFLAQQGVVAIQDIDTRELVTHLRTTGAMQAIISTLDSDPDSLMAKLEDAASLSDDNPVATASCDSPWVFDPQAAFAAYPDWVATLPEPRHKVVALDCGITRSALRHLARAGCEVTVVPWDTAAAEVLALEPDGVFVSGGPGHPAACRKTIETIEALFGRLPIFGLGLGMQLIALAAGGRVEALRFGHNGSNIPVMDLRKRLVYITSQHHRYKLLFESLGALIPDESGGNSTHVTDGDLRFWAKEELVPVVGNERFGRIQLTHININDGSMEGMSFLDIPVICLQYHPAVAPDATEADISYQAFVQLMEAQSKEGEVIDA